MNDSQIEWVKCVDGPWESEAEAKEFAEAECPDPSRVVEENGHWWIYLEKMD